MGRGGNEIDPTRLLYGEKLASRSDDRRAMATQETVFPNYLFGSEHRVISTSIDRGSMAINIETPEGPKIFLARDDEYAQLEGSDAPRGRFKHQRLDGNQDIFLWQAPSGWTVATADTSVGSPPLLIYSTNIPGSESQLTTIENYPKMAWVEIREKGEYGLALCEEDSRAPCNPSMALTSYPCSIEGEPGNVKAIYNPDGDEIIVVWSEKGPDSVRIRAWGSQTGTETLHTFAGDEPAEIHSVQLQNNEPVVTFSPYNWDTAKVCTSEGILKGNWNAVKPEILVTDDGIFSARVFDGELIIEQISGENPSEVTRIPGIKDYHLTGKDEPKLIYKSLGGNQKINSLGLETGRTSYVRDGEGLDLLGVETDDSGRSTVLALENPDRPRVISFEAL